MRLVARVLPLVFALAGTGLLDLVGVSRFGSTAGRTALACGVCSALAAIAATASHWLTQARAEDPPNSRLRRIRSTLAALFAGTLAFALVRVETPWLSLGPFGAGPIGELALVVLPLSVWIGALAAAPPGSPSAPLNPGASRTPPSSRRP